MIGTRYNDGRGVEKNDEQAMYWYQKAADQGDQAAKEALKDLEE